MRAVVIERPAPIEVAPLRMMERPDPVPGPRQILIDVGACGACHTDLHECEGDIHPPTLPVVPGHQVVGRIRERGEGAERFEVGDRVGVPWLFSSCGECDRCREGRENLCRTARFTGFSVDGGYAELLVAPEDFVYPVPNRFSDVAAAPLLCAGIIGYRALRLSAAKKGQVLGLFGFGASAHITIQVAVHLGIEVYVYSRTPAHRKLAENLGATWTGSAGDAAPRLLDAAISFAPAGGLVPQILAAMDRGARLALAGVTMSPVPELDYDRLLYQERSVTSVANFTRQDAEDLLRYAGEIPIRTEVTEFPFEEANRALGLVKSSGISGAAVFTW